MTDEQIKEREHWISYIKLQNYHDHAKVMTELLDEIKRLKEIVDSGRQMHETGPYR